MEVDPTLLLLASLHGHHAEAKGFHKPSNPDNPDVPIQYRPFYFVLAAREVCGALAQPGLLLPSVGRLPVNWGLYT